MAIDRKTVAYAASRILHDSKTPKERGEFVLALVSAYEIAVDGCAAGLGGGCALGLVEDVDCAAGDEYDGHDGYG